MLEWAQEKNGNINLLTAGGQQTGTTHYRSQCGGSSKS